MKQAFAKPEKKIKPKLPDTSARDGGSIIPKAVGGKAIGKLKREDKKSKEFNRKQKDNEKKFRNMLVGGIKKGTQATVDMAKDLGGAIKETAEKIESPIALLSEPLKELKQIISPFIKRAFGFIKKPAQALFAGAMGLFKKKKKPPPTKGEEDIAKGIRGVDKTGTEGFKKNEDLLAEIVKNNENLQEILTDQHRENMRFKKKEKILLPKKEKKVPKGLLGLLGALFLPLLIILGKGLQRVGFLFKTVFGKGGLLAKVFGKTGILGRMLGGVGTFFKSIFGKGGLISRIFGKGSIIGRMFSKVGIFFKSIFGKGGFLAKVLRPFSKVFGAGGFLSKVFKFLRPVLKILPRALKFLKFIPVVGQVIAVVMGIIDGFLGFRKAQKIWGKKLTLLQTISGIIGGIISGLSFGLLDMKKTIKVTHKVFKAIGDFFVKTIPNFWKKTKKFVLKTIPDSFRQIKKSITDFFTVTIPDFFEKLWEDVSFFFTDTIPDVTKKVWKGIEKFFTETIPKILVSAKDFIKKIGDTVWDKIKGFFTETIPKILASPLTFIKEVKDIVWDKIKGFFTETIPKIFNSIKHAIFTAVIKILPESAAKKIVGPEFVKEEKKRFSEQKIIAEQRRKSFEKVQEFIKAGEVTGLGKEDKEKLEKSIKSYTKLFEKFTLDSSDRDKKLENSQKTFEALMVILQKNIERAKDDKELIQRLTKTQETLTKAFAETTKQKL